MTHTFTMIASVEKLGYVVIVLFFISLLLNSTSLVAEEVVARQDVVVGEANEARQLITSNSASKSVNAEHNTLFGAAKFIQLFGALALVVAIILACGWLAKRFGHGVFAGNQVVKVKSVLPLGGKEKIVVINVKGEELLLGVTAHNISLLHRLGEEPSDSNRFGELTTGDNVVDASNVKTPRLDFAKKLQQMIDKGRIDG